MKEIKLANGKGIVLVDNEDYIWLSKYNWHFSGNGYAQTDIKVNGVWKSKSMHRLIMNPLENMQVDHIDHNIFNNQKSNLRVVTSNQNRMNRLKQINGISKFKGVSWHKRGEVWQSRIQKDKKLYWLGQFKDEKDAARAYNKEAEKLFGEYAHLNIIEE